MSLLFNMLSRLVIAFVPRSKRLLISWLQSPSAVILESTKIKFVPVSIVSPSICREMMEPVRYFTLGSPKSLQMVIAATKLKDARSLEEKL